MHEYLQCILLPEKLINDLCNQDIETDTKDYLEKVQLLSQMLIKSKDPEIADSKALEEVRPELEKLKFKVCSRARNFIIAKLNNLKKPKTNFQIYQESVLLKYKPLVAFLREHHKETYLELTSVYAEIMDIVYYTQLRQYFNDTAKLIEKTPKGGELLFTDRASAPGFTRDSNVSASATNASMTFEFSDTIMTTSAREQAQVEVEDRANVLQKIDENPIVVAISQSKHHFAFEEVFRSQNKVIVDTVCKEFVFVLEFFDLKMAQVSQIFNQIFARVINKYLEWLS